MSMIMDVNCEDIDKVAKQQAYLVERYKDEGIASLVASQNYDAISRAKEKFTDSLFPPNLGSIYRLVDDVSIKEAKKIQLAYNNDIRKMAKKESDAPESAKKIVWRRLSEQFNLDEYNIYKEKYRINNEGEQVVDNAYDDIIQGNLGDCYFLCALSAIAEFPERIRDLFTHMTVNKNGVFECIFLVNGISCQVVVDDYFPFYETTFKDLNSPKKYELAYANICAETNNLWPMILEKAWAKFNLSYGAIAKGLVSEAFEILFPGPIESYPHHIYGDKLWDITSQADKNKYLICADIGDDGESANPKFYRDYMKSMGLITDHAYSVMLAKELKDSHGKLIANLLQLRNPWGKFEWTGEWSDGNNLWNDEYQHVMEADFKDDGIFFMNIMDFIKHFTCTHVCKVIPNYKYSYETMSYDVELIYNLTELVLTETGKTFIIVNQKNSRIYKNTKGLKSFESYMCSLIVFKKVKVKFQNGEEEKEEFEYIDSVCGRHNRLYVEIRVNEPATYIVCVSFPAENDEYLQSGNLKMTHHRTKSLTKEITKHHVKREAAVKYTLGVYTTQKKVKLNPYYSERNPTDYLTYPMYYFASLNPSRQHFLEEDENQSWRACYLPEDRGSLGFLVYDNRSTGYIYERMTFNKLENVNIISIIDQSKNVQSLRLDDDCFLLTKEEMDLEDNLQLKKQLESRISMLNKVDKEKGSKVSVMNPLRVQLSVSPESKAILIFEKFNDTAKIMCDTEIVFSYPLEELLKEYLFPGKKNKIKYRDTFTDITETIIEHTTGIIFKYENKSSRYRLISVVNFVTFDNLELKDQFTLDKYSRIVEDKKGWLEKKATKQIALDKLDEEFRDMLLNEDNSVTTVSQKKNSSVNVTSGKSKQQPELKQIVLEKFMIDVKPGETKIVVLSKIDRYDYFQFTTDTTYIVAKSVNVNLNEESKGP